jgi:hypothetical protein
VELNTEYLYNKLTSEGIAEEQASHIVSNLKDHVQDVVNEKTTMTHDDFMDAVTSDIKNAYSFPENRTMAAAELERFIRTNPEVSNSIKLYASYIIYGAADVALDEYRVVISGGNTSQVQEAEKDIRKWEHTSRIRQTLFPVAKELVSYGDAFLEKIYYGSDTNLAGVSFIPSKTMHTKVNSMGHAVKYYQILENGLVLTDNMFAITSTDFAGTPSISTLLSDKRVVEFERREIAHFNDGSAIGMQDTTFYNLIVLWKFLKMLEESLIIHRVTRARRFVVFFLDVTGKTGKEIRASVSAFTGKLKQIFRFDFSRGIKTADRSTLPASSDLVIPITKDSATKVQTIPSDISATKLDDLKFYLNRVTTNLFTSHIFSEQKTNKEEYVEKAFMRMVRIYQKQMQFTLRDLYEEVLEGKGYKDLQVEILFPSPDTQQEIKIVDTIVRRMMIVNQMIATLGVVPPNKWVVNYVFKDLSQFEVTELIALLEFEKEKRENTAEGEEYPSLFEENAWGSSPENDSAAEEPAKERSNIPTSSSVMKDMLTGYHTASVQESTITQQYSDNMHKVIEQSLKYLELSRNKKQKDN